MDDEIEAAVDDEQVDPGESEVAEEAVETDAQTQESPEEEPEVVITIGDEAPPETEDDHESDTPQIRAIRESNREKTRLLREKDKRIRELEQAQAKPAATVPELGKKPTLESCEYDEEKFERELDAYSARKRAVAEEKARQEDAQKAQQAEWDATLKRHNEHKSKLKVSDYEDAEATVEASLSATQRGIIRHVADNSAQLEYAIGKSPATAKELGAIKDPVKFTAAVARLETKLKVTPRKQAPLPEKIVRGSASKLGAVDNKLAALEAKAEKTGDRSEIIAYNRAKRKAA